MAPSASSSAACAAAVLCSRTDPMPGGVDQHDVAPQKLPPASQDHTSDAFGVVEVELLGHVFRQLRQLDSFACRVEVHHADRRIRVRRCRSDYAARGMMPSA